MSGPGDYGAVFDGTTDDTTALQAWIDAGAEGVMPQGVAIISAPLVIDPAGSTPSITIRGSGRAARYPQGFYTEIRQTGGNCPIFEIRNSLSASLFADFTLSWGDYEDVPLTTDTDKVAFLFAPTDPPATWFNNVWENLSILRGYKGWQIAPTPGDMCSLWGNRWTSILADDFASTIWDLSPTVANGQPVNTFTHIYVNNANRDVVPTGPVFAFAAVEAVMVGVDIEGWVNQVLTATGSFPITMLGVHIEHHEIDASTPNKYSLFAVQGPFTLDGCSISGTSGGGQFGITAVANPLDAASTASLNNIQLAWSSVTGVSVLVIGQGHSRIGAWQVVTGTEALDRIWYGAGDRQRCTVLGPTVKPESGATGARPSAAFAGNGAEWHDETLGRPIWSNGTVWKDADGVTV